MAQQPLVLRPQTFPNQGYELLDPDVKIEEETLPHYRATNYYPMRIGEIIDGRYQVFTKLGYGTTSTVWLARDLSMKCQFWVLKVYVNNFDPSQEVLIMQHLARFPDPVPGRPHVGRRHVRKIEHCLSIEGPHGVHQVFVMVPMGGSLYDLKAQQDDGTFDAHGIRGLVKQLLLGLYFLHGAGVIHTDLHLDNLLVTMTQFKIVAELEEDEKNTPIARKVIGDRVIYTTQLAFDGLGPIVISDLGQARLGASHRGKVMPDQYRAPEVILGMEWGSAIDVWSLGHVVWELIDPYRLYAVWDEHDQEVNDAHHLAAMTIRLGPPPSEFLERSDSTRKYWDKTGRWIHRIPLPTDIKPVKDLSPGGLTGKECDIFLQMVRKCFEWLPEKRLTVEQLLVHPYMRPNLYKKMWGEDLPSQFNDSAA